MVGVLAGALAFAAPTFVAPDPGDVRVAEEAWSAAVACTGWEAPHRAEVRIERGYVPGGYLGRAFHDGGLSLIEIAATADRLDEVIVHEVAHAWVSSGPTTLAEGRAELLADCMVERRPGLAPLQWDDGRELAAMPDLKAWSNGHPHGPVVLGDARTDAYLGAARLVRAAATVVPPHTLWPREGLDWDGFRALMTEAGPDGLAVLAVLDADVQTQRAALADDDRDGWPTLVERLNGTRADRWDTDGDGWWDGAEVPPGAVPVPLDGSPVCTGLAAGPDGATAQVVTGGDLRGVTRPRVTAVGEDDATLSLPPGTPLVVHATLDAAGVSGGLWARGSGAGLVHSDACRAGRHGTVWAGPAHADRVAALVDAIDEAADAARARWGPTPGRVAVAAGGHHSTVRDATVVLGDEDLVDLDGAARLAVALHRSWALGQPDWRSATAMARMLAEDAPTH